MKWLISTRYPKERDKGGQILIFWDDETGKITEKEYGKDHKPYFYTRLTEKQIKSIRKVEELGYTINGEWNKDKVVGCKRVEKIHPRTRKKVPVTKVIVTHPNYVTNTNGTGLSQLILPVFTYNNHIKYADLFNIEHNITIGMPYDTEKIEPIIDWYNLKKHPIYSLKPLEKYKGILPKRMFDWMMTIFTTPFPDLKQHIVAIDIEVDFNYRDALNPFDAVAPISSITLSYYKEDDIHHLTFILSDEMRGIETKEFNQKHSNHLIKVCDNETELIKKTLIFLMGMKQKFIVGYNIDAFDIPYITSRMQYLGIKDERIWGFLRNSYNDKKEIVKGLKGKFLIDLLPFFSNPSIKNYAFKGKYEKNSLDDVSKALLGEHKYDYEGRVTDLSLNELAYYNAQDTALCLKLMTFSDEIVVKLIFLVMRFAHMTIESACRKKVASIVTNLIYRALHFYNMLTISRDELNAVGRALSSSSTGKRYSGAIVIEPKRGVKHNIVVADIASLYPTMMVNNNLCFSTMNCSHSECKNNKIEVTKGAYHHVCTKHHGIISSLVGFIKDVRVYYFKKMRDKDPSSKAIEQFLKVLINASYGVAGFQGFSFYCSPAAECVTATGRQTILGIKQLFEQKGYEIFYGDSVTADTPIFIKYESDTNIYIINISDLKLGDKKVFTWTDQGWTQILKIHKHTTKKKIYRILSHSGCIDVTEDHSLIKSDYTITQPSKLAVGDNLLTSFPFFSHYPHDTNISEDEAWIMGFFFADGSCGKYIYNGKTSYSWHIDKRDKNLLTKALTKLKKIYNNITDFKIIDIRNSSNVYRIVPKGKYKPLVEKYLCFYDKYGYKIVPPFILNASRNIREAFLKGYLNGDGDKHCGNSLRFYTKGKSSAQTLYFLCNSLGYKVSINTRNDKPNVFRLQLSHKLRKSSSTIKKIVLLSNKEQEVYDLVTANHRFQAGIGDIIVHNTDSIFINNINLDDFYEIRKEVNQKFNVDIDIEETGEIIVLHKKKNYVIIENKNGKKNKIIKGLVGKKRDTPNIIKKAFDEFVEAISTFSKPNDIVKLYKKLNEINKKYIDFIRNRKGTIDDYKITKQLSRPISQYKNVNAPHIRAARLLIQLIQQNSTYQIDENLILKEGSFIEFIYSTPAPKNKLLGVTPIEVATVSDININKYLQLLNNIFSQLIEPIRLHLSSKFKTNKGVDYYLTLQK